MFDLLNLITKRQTNKDYVSIPFGSAIRFKRKELCMTLEEACEDICSLSYLSKVENNIICASEEYVEKFKERFKINDAYDYDMDKFKKHGKQIIQACLKNREIDVELLNYYEDRDDYQSLLVRFAYYVLKKDYKSAETPYRNLLELITSMPSDPFMLTIILINHVLYHEMRYLDGMELIKLVESKEKISSNMALLISKWKLKFSFKLNNH